MITFNPIHSNASLLTSQYPSSEKEILKESLSFQRKRDTNAHIKAINTITQLNPHESQNKNTTKSYSKNPPHRRFKKTQND